MNEIDSIVIAFLDTRSNGKDVRSKIISFSGETNLLREQTVGPLVYGLTLQRVCLALSSNASNDHRSAIAANRLPQEWVFTFLQRYKPDNRCPYHLRPASMTSHLKSRS
jgi:hypothetical protein